jgi:hypothetical protein
MEFLQTADESSTGLRSVLRTVRTGYGFRTPSTDEAIPCTAESDHLQGLKKRVDGPHVPHVLSGMDRKLK